MLQDFGVEGIKVQEVFSLDEEFLACLPYALIPNFNTPDKC